MDAGGKKEKKKRKKRRGKKKGERQGEEREKEGKRQDFAGGRMPKTGCLGKKLHFSCIISTKNQKTFA